jgi:hypothetical protein
MNKQRDPGALDPERKPNQKNRSEQRSSSPFLGGLPNAWSSEMHFLVQVKIAPRELTKANPSLTTNAALHPFFERSHPAPKSACPEMDLDSAPFRCRSPAVSTVLTLHGDEKPISAFHCLQLVSRTLAHKSVFRWCLPARALPVSSGERPQNRRSQFITQQTISGATSSPTLRMQCTPNDYWVWRVTLLQHR